MAKPYAGPPPILVGYDASDDAVQALEYAARVAAATKTLLQVVFAYIGPSFGRVAWSAHVAGFLFGIVYGLYVRAAIARRVKEPWWIALADTILFHDPRENVEVRGNAHDLRKVPPHKSLFNAPPDNVMSRQRVKVDQNTK